MSEPLLRIEDLHAIDRRRRHRDPAGREPGDRGGEIHAIMGPNGSGKSTLSKVLSGHPAYEVTEGEVTFKGQNLLELEVDERARAGFSSPSSIRSTSRAYRSRTSCGRRCSRARPGRGAGHLRFPGAAAGPHGAAGDGSRRSRAQCERGLQRRREEAQRDPAAGDAEAGLAVMDETDSGLDIDALKVVSTGVNKLHERTAEMGDPADHALSADAELHQAGSRARDGAVAGSCESGGPELAEQLEASRATRAFTGRVRERAAAEVSSSEADNAEERNDRRPRPRRIQVRLRHGRGKPVFKAQQGLSEDIVRQISAHKDEPEWMLDLPAEGAADLLLEADAEVGW